MRKTAKSFPAEGTWGNRRNAASCNCVSHTAPSAHQPPDFLNKCRDPRIDELRLDGLTSPLAKYARPQIGLDDIQQQQLHRGFEPVGSLRTGTLRTVTITARVEDRVLVTALFAAILMMTQSRRAAQSQFRERALHLRRSLLPMSPHKFWRILPEDIGDGNGWPGLKSVSSKPRGFLRSASSSPCHPSDHVQLGGLTPIRSP